MMCFDYFSSMSVCHEMQRLKITNSKLTYGKVRGNVNSSSLFFIPFFLALFSSLPGCPSYFFLSSDLSSLFLPISSYLLAFPAFLQLVLFLTSYFLPRTYFFFSSVFFTSCSYLCSSIHLVPWLSWLSSLYFTFLPLIFFLPLCSNCLFKGLVLITDTLG